MYNDIIRWSKISGNNGWEAGKSEAIGEGGNMTEEMAVFKGYLRSLMRQLKLLKKAIEEKDFESAKKLIDELIEDTQSNIED